MIDDSSGERLDSFVMDNSMKRLITSVRHYNTVLWVISQALAGTLSTFMRTNVDVLILYNVTNQALIEMVFQEFLSLNTQYRKQETNRKNITEFVNQYLELHNEPYNALYLNLRTRKVYDQVKKLVDILKKYYP